MEPKVVGEGTYGCVIKPSLKCRNKRVNYTNRLAKVMRKNDAADEYLEMKNITKTPGIEKYIMSMPDICSPVLDSTFFNTVKKCENKKFPALNPNDFRMLIFEDGGVSLRQFEESVVSTLSNEDFYIFLTKVYDLLEGLCFFHLHDIVHHDINDKNVVYNISTGKFRFIDFGLMKKRSRLIVESKQSINSMATSWSNFPPEYECANFNKFEGCRFNINYNTFISRVAYTFDWYSTGIMMSSFLEDVFRKKTWNIPPLGMQQLIDFFERMGEPNINKRNYNIETMKNEYKKILKQNNIWLVKTPSPSENSIAIQNKFMKKKNMHLPEKSILFKHFKTKMKKYSVKKKRKK